MTMTLDELAVLLDLAAPNGAQRNQDSILRVLEREQLIEAKVAAWEVSERGRVFIEHIMEQPLPEQSWVMPETIRYKAPPMLGLRIAAIEDDDGPAPPAPPAKLVRRIEDPTARQAEAMRMMNAGYGLIEIKDELALTADEMTEYFGKWGG